MRNLPIALASVGDEQRLIRDSFLNAIITHGHPRAIIGTILFGLAVRYVILQKDGHPTDMIEYLRSSLENTYRSIADERNIRTWVSSWERGDRTRTGSFRAVWSETKEEAHRYLSAAQNFVSQPIQEYYKLVGAFAPATKGSGLGTVCAAIFLFLRDNESPDDRLFQAVNMMGSDTDTIASFLGALLGARFGLGAVPQHLFDPLQDREYLLKVASRLHVIAEGRPSEYTEVDQPLDKQEAFLRILAWEIGLHEMFWDAIDVGGNVMHPTLGRGRITQKHVQRIGREGYVTRLIGIRFDCGQSCVFHSRVEHDDKVTESLGMDIEQALGYRPTSSR